MDSSQLLLNKLFSNHITVSNILLCQKYYCVKHLLEPCLPTVFFCRHAAVISCCACEAPQLLMLKLGKTLVSLSVDLGL